MLLDPTPRHISDDLAGAELLLPLVRAQCIGQGRLPMTVECRRAPTGSGTLRRNN